MADVQSLIPDHIQAPDCIQLKWSKANEDRIGAFSVSKINKGTEFGPFQGRMVLDKDDPHVDQKYSWEVFDLKTFKYLYTVDATNPADGNWMRYVCCARFFEEQNIVSTQNGDQVYYKALKDINQGEELLTWFQPKKKRRKKSSTRLSLDSTEEIPNQSMEQSQTESPPKSPGKVKRKRKPKIIPDSYDGPFDFEEKVNKPLKTLKASKDDIFEPLQPGQKRRRRKKTFDSQNGVNTSETSMSDKSVSDPFKKETFVTPENLVKEQHMESQNDIKKPGHPKNIADINETVDWDFPVRGEEYNFELLSHHVVSLNGKKAYKCDICLGLYKHMFSLKRHYLRNHINYKYLSKADLTNCLINLAQAKLNMSGRRKMRNSSSDKGVDEDNEKDVVNEQLQEENNSEKCDQEGTKNNEDTKQRSHVLNGDIASETEMESHTSNEGSKSVENKEQIDNNKVASINSVDQNEVDDSEASVSSSGLNSSTNSSSGFSNLGEAESCKGQIKTGSEESGWKTALDYPGLFQCYTCYEVFDTVLEIRTHLKEHIVQKQDNSPNTDLTNDDIEEEEKLKTPSKKKQLSSKSHVTPENRPEPKQEVEEKKVYRCGVCPFKYDSQDALVAHVENKHKTSSKYQCKYCGKDFLSMPNMKKHVRFHLGYRATCRECDETFSNVGSLRKHTRVAHPEVYRARLVERLEKYGVLRGPDKNALKKKIVDKVIAKKAKKEKEPAVKEENENKVSASEQTKVIDSEKSEKSEFQADIDLSFAADEIDDGGSRFKFSCTVCKKRFSSYINMCRHRRKAHGNETKSRSEQCLTLEHQRRAPSPIVYNPEEIAAFYANVSHNIANNLNCYIDGKPDSLVSFADHIKIEGYTLDGKISESIVTDFNWEYYNFPRDFHPGTTVSFFDIKNGLNIHNDFEDHCTSVDSRSDKDSAKGVKVTASDENSEKTCDESIEDRESAKQPEKEVLLRNSDTNIKQEEAELPEQKGCESSGQEKIVPFYQSDKMGIASYGMKVLSRLVQGNKASSTENYKPGQDDGAKFFKLRIADGLILNTESPAARTFHQVQRGEYANFQDDLLCHEDSPIWAQTPPQNDVNGADVQSDDESQMAETAYLSQTAQEELDSLYSEIDGELSDTAAFSSPKPLSYLCEQLLGLSPVTRTKYKKCICPAVNSEVDSFLESRCIKEENTSPFRDEKPDFSDASEDSPFYNYNTIAFGKNGAVQNICLTCKRQFKDIETLLGHHWKKHPGTVCGSLEVEQGNGIEELHFTEPSCVGALAVTDIGLENTSELESFKCTFCGEEFKTMSKLHVHIISCSPIDPVYGAEKSDWQSRTALRKKLHRKYQGHFGNLDDSKGDTEYDRVSINSARSNKSGSQKRVFTGCRKWKSVILPDSPVKEPVETGPVVTEKPQQSVVAGYNPLKHVRRRELTEVVDLLTCEGCGLKCKTIILLERHVRHCTRKEKFRTMKPLACPIIDDAADKVKNMCFYCEKNFTYTKSLINHFQDFCPVKKAKLDKGEITEEHKQKEAAILDRIQKSEEEKVAQKEKEMETRTKRKITWAVGRKPKRKGNAWTIVKRKYMQSLTKDGTEIDGEAERNDETGEMGEVKNCGSADVAEESNPGVVDTVKDDRNENLVKNDDIVEKVTPRKVGRPRKHKVEMSQDRAKEDEETCGSENAGENEDTNILPIMNTSLNLTTRYKVNEVKPVEKNWKNDLKSGASSLFSQCTKPQLQEPSRYEGIQRRRSKAKQPDPNTIIEGKRKRERIGKVEEFLKNAFSRKRKRKSQEEKGESDLKTEEINSSQDYVESGELNIPNFEYFPKNGCQNTFHSESLSVNVSSTVNNTSSNSTGNPVSIASSNSTSVVPLKKPRGRPRKSLENVVPVSISETVCLINENSEHKPQSSQPNDVADGAVVNAVDTSGNADTNNLENRLEENCKSQTADDDDDEQVVPECEPSGLPETERKGDNDKEIVNKIDNCKSTELCRYDDAEGSDADSVDGDLYESGSKGNKNSIEDKTQDKQLSENLHFQIKACIKNNVICTTDINILPCPSYTTWKDMDSICYSTSSISDKSDVSKKLSDASVSNSETEGSQCGVKMNTVDPVDVNIEKILTKDVQQIASDVVEAETQNLGDETGKNESTKEMVKIKEATCSSQVILSGDNDGDDDDSDEKSDITASTVCYDSSREMSPLMVGELECDKRLTVNTEIVACKLMSHGEVDNECVDKGFVKNDNCKMGSGTKECNIAMDENSSGLSKKENKLSLQNEFEVDGQASTMTKVVDVNSGYMYSSGENESSDVDHERRNDSDDGVMINSIETNDFADESCSSGNSVVDWKTIDPVLSPGERVKMNRRSCKKEVDLSSPVWIKRTKQHPHIKSERKECDQQEMVQAEVVNIGETVNGGTCLGMNDTDGSSDTPGLDKVTCGKNDESKLKFGKGLKRKLPELKEVCKKSKIGRVDTYSCPVSKVRNRK